MAKFERLKLQLYRTEIGVLKRPIYTSLPRYTVNNNNTFIQVNSHIPQ